MDAFLEWLSIPSLSSGIGIAGIILALVTLWYSRSVYRISVHSDTNDLLGMADPLLPRKVDVFYDGEPVENLVSSSFVVWNSGNKVIGKDALKTIEPLRIELNGQSKILNLDIVKINNPTTNISLTPDSSGKTILLGFDFLEKNNGFRLEVLHTGEAQDISVEGKVIGVTLTNKSNFKLALRKAFSYKVIERMSIKSLSKTFITISILIYLTTVIWPEFFINTNPDVQKDHLLWLVRFSLIPNIALGILLMYAVKLPYPASLKKSREKKQEN